MDMDDSHLQVPDSPASKPIYRSRPGSVKKTDSEISAPLSISIGPSGCENTIELEEIISRPAVLEDLSSSDEESNPLESLQRLRESMNERIDVLMTHFINQKAMRSPLDEIEKTHVNRRSSMKHPNTPKTPRTAQSPARVSFQEDPRNVDKES